LLWQPIANQNAQNSDLQPMVPMTISGSNQLLNISEFTDLPRKLGGYLTFLAKRTPDVAPLVESW